MTDTSAILPFPQTSPDRLRLAMRRLQDAVAAQANAMQAFRAELGALRQATQGLEGSLDRYRSALTGVTVELVQAKAAARSLEQTAAWMDASA
jgi:ABC-type phosphate transport system auxiliary subunit